MKLQRKFEYYIKVDKFNKYQSVESNLFLGIKTAIEKRKLEALKINNNLTRSNFTLVIVTQLAITWSISNNSFTSVSQYLVFFKNSHYGYYY